MTWFKIFNLALNLVLVAIISFLSAAVISFVGAPIPIQSHLTAYAIQIGLFSRMFGLIFWPIKD